MGDKKTNFYIKTDAGQSVVEYILLLSVVMLFAFTIFRSNRFKRFFGPDSEFFGILRNRMEYSYRHGLTGDEDSSSYSGNHDTYFNQADGRSRFFISEDPYDGS